MIDFPIDVYCTNINCLIEDLMEEIKALVSEEKELEDLDEPNFAEFFWEDNQELEACMKTKGISIRSTFKSVKFLIQDLMEEMKLLVPEKKV